MLIELKVRYNDITYSPKTEFENWSICAMDVVVPFTFYAFLEFELLLTWTFLRGGNFRFFRAFVYFAKNTPTRKQNPYAFMKEIGVVS